MIKPLRIIDTGLRTGRENIAFDAAMLEARKNGDIIDTLRFIHFKPCALVGRHQDVSQEIKIENCKAKGVEIVRRITGGGAIYFDEGQLGWALACSKASLGTQNLGEIAKIICEAAAFGLSKLGVNAKFRPRNDIEIDGKKISGTGGFFDGDTLMYQGTVLIDLDPIKMVDALNVPAQKMSRMDDKEHASRVTTLKAVLGCVPPMEEVKTALTQGFQEKIGFAIQNENPSEIEENLATQFYSEEIGTDDFVYEINDMGGNAEVLMGTEASAGGVVSAFVRLESNGDRLREVIFAGDFFVAPPRIIYDLESHLRGTKTQEFATNINDFFAKIPEGGLLSIGAPQFIAAMTKAIS